MKVLHSLRALVALVFAFVLPGLAMASTGPDFSSLTSGIDMSSVITAILAAAGILIGVLVAKKGAHLIMGFFGR